MNKDASIVAQCLTKLVVPHFPPAEWDDRAKQALQVYQSLLTSLSGPPGAQLSGQQPQGGSTASPGGAPAGYLVEKVGRNKKGTGSNLLLRGDHPAFTDGDAFVGFFDRDNPSNVHLTVQAGQRVECTIKASRDGQWLNGTDLGVVG